MSDQLSTAESDGKIPPELSKLLGEYSLMEVDIENSLLGSPRILELYEDDGSDE